MIPKSEPECEVDKARKSRSISISRVSSNHGIDRIGNRGVPDRAQVKRSLMSLAALKEKVRTLRVQASLLDSMGADGLALDLESVAINLEAVCDSAYAHLEREVAQMLTREAIEEMSNDHQP